MPALNKVQLIGRLGADPDGKFTPRGSQVCTFNVAVNRRWKNSDGEQKTDTEWFKIEAWDSLARICQDYLHKGSLVYLEGRLRTDRWESEEGITRTLTKVVARELQMLDPANGEPAEPEGQSEDE